MRHTAVIAVVTLTVLGLVALAMVSGGVAASEHSDIVHECAAEPPDDFSEPEEGNATIGWFDGYWYDEPLDLNASEGITPDELENLSARTAARLEAMRCLAFDELPSVEIIDREEFANETAEDFAGIPANESQFDNAQFETMLLIGSEEDSIDVREEGRTATVAGYYNFVEKRIVVISEDPERLMIDEEVLAHELGHALQDQHFNLSEYRRDTTDMDKAKLGVIEGDVHRIEMEYLELCEADAWAEPCVTQDTDGASGGAPPNWGLYFTQFQPYSDGPNFIDHVYDQGGWEAVNALYDDMPDTARHVIYPEKYPSFEPANLSVPDNSSEDWDRLEITGQPDYDVVGQAGMSAMFMDIPYDDGISEDEFIVHPNDFLNLDPETREIDEENPLNYDLQPTDGWAGDRLYVYGDEAENTATLWRTAWTSQEEQAQFLAAYEQLAAYRGGERVDGYAHTWTFGADSEFDMALTLYPDDEQLWIVTAPTVEDLTDIHPTVELVDEDEVDNRFPRDDSVGDDSTAPADDTSDDDPGDGSDDTIVGFGLIVTIFSAIVATYLYRRKGL